MSSRRPASTTGAIARNPALFSSAIPTLEASNQSQIDDLVQRNRTLAHTNQKLSSQLAVESARSKDAISAIQAQHAEAQSQWREAFEDVIGSYRIVQRRLEVEVERERLGFLLWGEEAIRREKIDRMKWEYKIRLFMMREEEMERKVEEVEGEMRRAEEEYEGKIAKLKETCLDLLRRAKHESETVSRLEREVKEKDGNLAKMREVSANLEAQKETFTSQLGRAKRTLELEQQRKNELEEEFRKEKKRNHQLSSRMGECEDLEENAEREVAKLKSKLAQLEGERDETKEKAEKECARLDRELERERDKADRLQAEKDKWEQEAKANKKEADKMATLNRKTDKKLEKLKDDLEIERARIRPPSPQKPASSSSPIPPTVVKPRRAVSGRPSSTVKAGLPKTHANNPSSDDTEVPTIARPQVAKKRTAGKPPPPLKKPVVDLDDDDEIEEVKPKPDKGKGKGKARDVEDGDQEPNHPEKKRKRKALENETEEKASVEVDETPKPKPKPRPRPRSKRGASQLRETTPTAPARATRRGRSASRQPLTVASVVTDVGGGEGGSGAGTTSGEPPKKKLRKINVFPQVLGRIDDGGAASVLASFHNPSSTSALDIPSFLSPLKADEVVPPRSTAASAVGQASSSNSTIFKFGGLFGRR